jgi:hypothetical protein
MTVADSTAAPTRVSNPGTPDQNNLVPNTLQAAQVGPAYSYIQGKSCAPVTDINPVPPKQMLQMNSPGTGSN